MEIYKRDKKFMGLVGHFIQHPRFQKLDNIPQCHYSTRMEHSISVAYTSYKIVKKFDWDEKSTARGGLLHNFFHYDWRETKFNKGHAWVHPRIAMRNARRLTTLNKREGDIVLKHMWGATIAPPRYKKGYIVTMVDKYRAIKEAITPLRNRFNKRRRYSRKILPSNHRWNRLSLEGFSDSKRGDLMNHNDVICTQTGGTSNRLFAKIYGLVGVGIGLSALVSFLTLYVFTDNTVNIIVYHSFVHYGVIFLELALALLASNAARKNMPAALPLFLFYSALNGFTPSSVIVAYTQTMVVQAFVSSALVFGVMAIIGTFVEKGLSGMAGAFMAALIGIIITSLVNMFIGSGTMSCIISIISVLTFSGLIVCDNQMIKRVYESTSGNVGDGWAISMALSLCLDFINLFLSLLRIFGSDD